MFSHEVVIYIISWHKPYQPYLKPDKFIQHNATASKASDSFTSVLRQILI